MKFTLDSSATLLETELVVARDSQSSSASSSFSVEEPVLEMRPGQGVSCGSLDCHKYASCVVQFSGEEQPQCECPPGFSGRQRKTIFRENF